MKRKLLQITGLMLSLAVFFVACNKEKDTTQNNATKKLVFSSYQHYGDLHNDFLTNALNNFNEDPAIKATQAKIDYIDRFQQNYVPLTALSTSERADLSSALFDYRHLILYPDLYQEAFVQNAAGVSLASQIDDLLNYGLIDAFEHGVLKNLLVKIQGNLDGNITNDQLENFVNNAVKDWEAMGYTQSSTTGRLLPVILSISVSSIDWWKNHPGADRYKTAALPAWAAADVAGGLVSGVSTIIVQYTVTGDVHWGVVGGSVVAGAVVGSTGLVGRIAKWFS